MNRRIPIIATVQIRAESFGGWGGPAITEPVFGTGDAGRLAVPIGWIDSEAPPQTVAALATISESFHRGASNMATAPMEALARAVGLTIDILGDSAEEFTKDFGKAPDIVEIACVDVERGRGGSTVEDFAKGFALHCQRLIGLFEPCALPGLELECPCPPPLGWGRIKLDFDWEGMMSLFAALAESRALSQAASATAAKGKPLSL